ncbi:MAG: translation initiation factor IF-2 [Planctomycetes bacterium]|nr:translation initiation factor IF-2 [Planctomycetota bacterium]
MTTKKRVHELAKEYGMTGQALASKLQQLGFAKIKGPSSTLDDSELLVVEGTLQAVGVFRAQTEAPAAAEPDAAPGLHGLVKKKKKKVSLADLDGGRDEPEVEALPAAPLAASAPSASTAPLASATAPASTAPAPSASAPAPTEVPAPLEVKPSASAAKPAPAPEPELAQAPEPATPAAAPQAPAPAAPQSLEPLPVLEADKPALAAESTTLAEHAHSTAPDIEAPQELPAAPLEAEVEVLGVAPSAAAPEAPAPEGLPSVPTGKPTIDSASDLVRPAARRRPGKVVGFVDLSKMQSPTAPKKPDAKRLRSKDDVTPDVQPTLGHDKKRALLRGDQASRGQLTASQLREKESARFLRRKGATPATTPAARPSPRGRATELGSSPMSGGEVKVAAPVTIKKLAEAMSIKTTQLLARAMEQNLGMLNINSVLDDDTAQLLALEFGVALRLQHEVQAETELIAELVRKRTEVEEGDLILRAPSIAILGHVDHGKTTLIDRIRNSNIAESESGGITQHIGAYQVQTKSGHLLTIIDTPGHEAFTAMRARGADAVDIVVLVVAADDGVMPSTQEAIQHARVAKKKVVVALNKCDKPDANPKRVKEQLAKAELIPEEWGGDVAMLEISAKTGAGVDELLERVFLESEVLELKAHSKGPASGVVLEAEVEKGKGRVAHLLIKDGTLNKGDVIIAGEGYGRVRSIHDDRDRELESAGPSTPVLVTGLSELPSVGDAFYVVARLEQAREVAEERSKKLRMMSLAERKQTTSENILQALADQSKKVINVLLRCDVQGSLQALEGQIRGLLHPEVDVKLLSSGLGTVTESDVNLAATSGGLVLAFRVSTNSEAREAAERGNVEIRNYDVIYELLDDLRTMMEGTLAPEMTQQVTGHIEVRALFKSSKFGTIAGSHVIDGALQRDNKVRVLRKGKVVFETSIAGLRREKDDVREVREGFDCGVTLKDFDAYELGDVIEGYKVVAVKRTLGAR